MAGGVVYLVAIVEWFTRRVPVSPDAGCCIETPEKAVARYGKPAIFNSDQGAQFTGTAFTAVRHREKIAIAHIPRPAPFRSDMISQRQSTDPTRQPVQTNRTTSLYR